MCYNCATTMATVSFKVFKHHKKGNGQVNIKLVVYHNKKRSYLNTAHYVTESQLKKDYSVKDKDLLVTLASELAAYMKRVSDLGERINLMTAEQVGACITMKGGDADERINFIEFGRTAIEGLRSADRKSTAGTWQAVINNLVDFMGTDFIGPEEITSDFLIKYEGYLRKPYQQKRVNQFGKIVEVIRKGMTDAGIYAHMKDLRTIFNAARNKYNDEDLGIIRIRNYPFKKYKLREPGEREKRAIDISYVKHIRDIVLPPGGRAELARNIFMLSFYLCGMNAKDIYDLRKADVKSGRVVYHRSKTKDKRPDKALFSVKLIPEAREILEKCIDKIRDRYSTSSILNKALAVGTKQIAQLISDHTGEPVVAFDPYSARHTFATEARNTCEYSVNDVAEALNHKDKNNRTTDGYIKKSWALVDKIQADVVGLLNEDADQ